MSKNELKKLVSFGNKKLPKSTAILNMGSANSCPSDALGLCNVSKICYAKKAEKHYPNVEPYRDRQQAYWLSTSATDIVSDLLLKFARRRTKTRALRLNESGDFWSQDCVTKAEEIARLLKNQIRVYVYTARRDLDFSACKHLIVNGSNFKSEGVKRSFTAMTPRQIRQLQTSNVSGLLGDAVVNICPMDCTICALCASNSKKDIVVAMH